MLYLDNRKYLPPDSALRTEGHGFPNNSEESDPPPAKKRFCDIKKHHRAYNNELIRYTCVHVCDMFSYTKDTVAIANIIVKYIAS